MAAAVTCIGRPRSRPEVATVWIRRLRGHRAAVAVDALRDADAAVIATEWPEFAAMDWAGLRGIMATPLVIDGRRLLDPSTMKDLGFRYERVGSPASPPTPVDRTMALEARARQ